MGCRRGLLGSRATIRSGRESARDLRSQVTVAVCRRVLVRRRRVRSAVDRRPDPAPARRPPRGRRGRVPVLPTVGDRRPPRGGTVPSGPVGNRRPTSCGTGRCGLRRAVVPGAIPAAAGRAPGPDRRGPAPCRESSQWAAPVSRFGAIDARWRARLMDLSSRRQRDDPSDLRGRPMVVSGPASSPHQGGIRARSGALVRRVLLVGSCSASGANARRDPTRSTPFPLPCG